MRWIFVIVLILLLTNAWAQLPTHEVSNRVAASDPISGAGSAMPVGLISDLMVVGDYADDEAGTGVGAVFSFKWNGSDWVEVQKIIPPNPQDGMWFGWSLSVDEQVDSGEAWLAVGAHRYAGNAGRVDLFERQGDLWVYKQTLENPGANFYGFDLDINVDIAPGQVIWQWDLVVGAPAHRFIPNSHNTGTVFVSMLNSLGLWTQGAIPLGAETFEGVNPQYGRSVALDGDVIIAGAPSLMVNGNKGAGAVAIFTRGQFSPWAGNTPIENPDAIKDELQGSNFGTDVDVVKQVVSPRNPTGEYYYLIGAPLRTINDDVGQVYLLEGNTWNTLNRPENSLGNDRFGSAVRFREDLENGNHQAIACARDTGTGGTGSVYLFDQTNFGQPWLPKATFVIGDADVQPGSEAVICRDLAAWGPMLAIAAPNGVPTQSAVYSNPVIIKSDGFEEP